MGCVRSWFVSCVTAGFRISGREVTSSEYHRVISDFT
jgi:hypothetical protein